MSNNTITPSSSSSKRECKICASHSHDTHSCIHNASNIQKSRDNYSRILQMRVNQFKRGYATKSSGLPSMPLRMLSELAEDPIRDSESENDNEIKAESPIESK
jgi:hypothetical protein